MLYLTGNDIQLTRGDSAFIRIDLTNDDDEPITLLPGDVVKIQVRDKQIDGDLLFEGRVTLDIENSCVYWTIDPADTKSTTPGKTYLWDGEIERESGEVYTFVKISKFKILPEITLKDSES